MSENTPPFMPNDGTGSDWLRRKANLVATKHAVVLRLFGLFHMPLFPLGRIVITPGAAALLDTNRIDASQLVARHQRGDWGSISAHDMNANDADVRLQGYLSLHVSPLDAVDLQLK